MNCVKHSYGVFVSIAVIVSISTLSSRAMAQNLIANGDFSSGNTDFSSAYIYVATPSPSALGPAGTYTVGSNPASYHGLWSSFGDHTTGSGQMMILNGSSTPNINVWTSSSIPVTPNTDYYFAAWLTSVYPEAPAILQFSVNGGLLGGNFGATSGTPDWQQFYVVWNSGSNTTVTLSIVNQNTAFSGNDFAIDDISLTTTPSGGINTNANAPEPASFALCVVGAMGAIGAMGSIGRTGRRSLIERRRLSN